MRTSRARSGRGSGGRQAAKSGIAGAAALIGAAALVVSVVPAQAVAAPPPTPGPAEVVPGKGTSTPSLVGGIREDAGASGSAADAAKRHLAGKKDRYRIDRPDRDLAAVQTVTNGTSETVRFQQKHRGVDVLGGQYVVRMQRQNGKRVVTGASGKYFTALTTGTTPEVSEELAVERAVDTTLAQLDREGFGVDTGEAGDAPPLSGTARGLVVLPKGPGVLTHHVTVRGTDPATRQPVLREVYIDAKAGYPVLQYSGIKTFGTAGGGGSASGSMAASPAGQRVAADGSAVKGSGVKFDGTTVELDLTHEPSNNQYVMRDTARMRDSSKAEISTWDVRKKTVDEVSGQWPSDVLEFRSPNPAFDKEATEAGAVDAHWAAGKVYDYYKSVHGRDSLDGRGMAINSMVGVTYYGTPYANAFWDGAKMVYGGGDAEYRPFSAALDVVGHEMTHGVVENSANLVYAGQSGALNEAIADYFGNAIDTDAHGTPMDSPDAGLLGEGLCRTKSPRACATRDMNDGRTTSKGFLGVDFATDNGGVHLNSTIFSGALWDIRKDLNRTLADKIVYRALTEYMTPLDGFTEGRNAVIAAAKDLGVTGKDLNAVTRAFNGHGIVPDWELAIGADTDQLLGRLETRDSRVGAGGGWWVASKSNESGSEPYSIWAGRADGTGEKKLISPNDGRFHINPVTDGKTVVWQAQGPRGHDLLSRPLAGGPVKTLVHSRYGFHQQAKVDGDVVVFVQAFRRGASQLGYLRKGDKEPTMVDDAIGRFNGIGQHSLKNGKIAYGTRIYKGRGKYEYFTKVLDIASGKTTVMPQLGTPLNVGQTAITSKYVFWTVDEVADQGQRAVRRANLDGTGVMDISKEQGADALYPEALTASEDAVTVRSRTPDTGPGYRNETLPKLWQFSVDGSRRARMSCNRGEQGLPAAVSGTQVVWIDSSAGYADLVTRTRPAGNCG
ncbi:M4 family metallopeptidase [Streptomyces sp. NPDC001678]|uniref:M4 family metallopeptidase n=1 Tax=Streptomyces sp. NPDC001678 TaxID=3364599 RepID=UPI003687198A